MKILLDTNFILTCIKEKIDFDALANEIFDQRIEWLLPDKVIQEIAGISQSQGAKKQQAKIALEIIKNLDYKKVKLEHSVVDEGIARYVNQHKVILATLDRKLKSRVGVKILTIRGGKSLELI